PPPFRLRAGVLAFAAPALPAAAERSREPPNATPSLRTPTRDEVSGRHKQKRRWSAGPRLLCPRGSPLLFVRMLREEPLGLLGRGLGALCRRFYPAGCRLCTLRRIFGSICRFLGLVRAPDRKRAHENHRRQARTKRPYRHPNHLLNRWPRNRGKSAKSRSCVTNARTDQTWKGQKSLNYSALPPGPAGRLSAVWGVISPRIPAFTPVLPTANAAPAVVDAKRLLHVQSPFALGS